MSRFQELKSSGSEVELDQQEVLSIPEMKLQRADIQQLVVSEEEVPPEQQEWSSSLDQEDPPEPPHIKEEQEEPWTSQEGEQLQGLEEADIIKFLFTPVPVKSEDDEEKPQSSQLHQGQTEQMETGADGEDCGGPEPARNSHPEANIEFEIEDFSETKDSQEVTDPQSGLTIQKKRHTDEDALSCSFCGKTFSCRTHVNKHMRIHTGEEPFSCSDCGKTFTWKEQLTRHMAVHTGEKPFSCSVCSKRFMSKGDVNIHMRIHTGEKPFGCSVCGKRFPWKGNVTRHMAVHSGEKPFSCSVCNKKFTCMRNVKIHMRIHTGEKPFSCSVCGKEFTQKNHLTEHMTNHTGVREKRFSCSVCEQRFTWDKQLRRHKLVCPQSSQLHQTEQNREAEPGASSSTEQMETGADGEDCGGPEPATNSHPETHSQLETKKKSAEISVAEIEVSVDDWEEKREPQSGLHSSPVSHLGLVSDDNSSEAEVELSDGDWDTRRPNKEVLAIGEKPLGCSECGKQFSTYGNLKRHMVTHTGEKPFRCSVCDKGFDYPSDVKRHMRTHTGEKPFSCSSCGKAFTRKQYLTRHMVLHTGEKAYSCSVCEQGFTLEKHLHRHKCDSRQSSPIHQNQAKEKGEADTGASSSTEQLNIVIKEEQEELWTSQEGEQL